LQKLTLENRTALYGHIKITNLPIEVSDIPVKPGQRITYLGNAFSNETSKERKYLHFGIYKGADLYFKGHETSLQQLNTRWEDPSVFLKEKGAKDPITNTGFLYAILKLVRILFNYE
jgi:hypothetical protein